MISIIICSRKQDIPSTLKQNIVATIKCKYELIVIDNSQCQYNIFQAYNEGVRRSKGEILCFMHDDILFHTNDWGNIIERTFAENTHIGAIGIAGAHIVVDAPAPMWSFQQVSTCKLFTFDPDYLTYAHNGGDNETGGYWFGNQLYAEGKGMVEVANIDGLWMCIRRPLFDAIRFDEETYSGFHCYDADISMQINAANYKIVVSNEILIEHASPGQLDADYFDAANRWYAKWRGYLPIVRGVDITPRQMEILRRYTIDALERQKELLEYRRLKSTHAYQLGSTILRPFRTVKDFFKTKKSLP